ncbi:MAG: 30S ribosomal protein S12 methylthiotransferase RimO, partial [Clostridiaceae bacterium]|nr:30S ribosomal protein S12 methylthiotransferase RimO [Clostridiaceae bacterium]
NTCGFIDDAKQESINAILEMAELKKSNCEFLVVTGCLAERYNKQILEEIPEVDAILGTGHFGDIVEIIKKAYSSKSVSPVISEKTVLYGNLGYCDFNGTERVLSTNDGFAYIKIADGCDNRCTYCIIPSLRGPYKSRKMESILEEAEYLTFNGVKEIILVAQDTTRYGTDLYGERKLKTLIKELSKINKLKWIRLLYCYPDQIDDELIDEIASNDKVCKYIDIPIQHFSDSILKKMGRRGNSAEIEELIIKLRKKIPQICIRTTFIVGFPGEEEEDFSILCDFVKRMEFDKMGVFMYSREEGTPAAKIKFQVKKSIKRERYEKLMSIQKNIMIKKNSSRLNKIYDILVEGVADDGIFYYGRSDQEAPDIDSLIYFTSSYPLERGTFVKVKILNTDEYDLIGVVENELTE